MCQVLCEIYSRKVRKIRTRLNAGAARTADVKRAARPGEMNVQTLVSDNVAAWAASEKKGAAGCPDRWRIRPAATVRFSPAHPTRWMDTRRRTHRYQAPEARSVEGRKKHLLSNYLEKQREGNNLAGRGGINRGNKRCRLFTRKRPLFVDSLKLYLGVFYTWLSFVWGSRFFPSLSFVLYFYCSRSSFPGVCHAAVQR